MLKQIADAMTLEQVRQALKANAKFMAYDDEFLSGVHFSNQVMSYTYDLNMNVSDIIQHYLKINGCV